MYNVFYIITMLYIFHILKKLLIVYVILLIIFITALTLSSLIPSALIKQNIGESLITFKKEGTYPSVGISWRQIALDNFTDALMFNTAYSINSNTPFKSALINLRLHNNIDSANQILSLDRLYLNQTKNTQQVGYERYWHGYLVFLRPLLLVFSYSGIRNIITFFLYSGFIFLSFLVWKKLGKRLALALILGLIAVDFFYLGKSIQFSSVFLIGIFTSTYLLLRYKKNNNLYILFFIAGGLTSFFDMLTAPMVTLGILLIMANSLDNKIKNIIINSVFWSIGYLSLWFSKWFIVQYLYSGGAIQTAFNTIIFRTVTKTEASFNQLAAINLNFLQLRGYDRFNKYVLLFCGVVFFLFWLRYFSFKTQKIKRIIPWVIIGTIPYLWFLIAANHTYYHVWYTYRNQLVSVVCLFLIVTEFMNRQRINEDLRLFKVRILSLSKFALKYLRN